jgi:hypothetical protein
VKAPEICKTCAAIKVTKASFKHRSTTASKPFEEIHLDLIGPISTMSHLKHKYILTIVDANTRFVAAIPLISKTDVYKTLTYAIDVEAKRLGYYPSILHSDRGTEFLNSNLERYCLDHVIKQRFSDEYTPQQNGLTERFNQTILESLRTLLMNSGFNSSLWNKILSTCTLTLNQIPSHWSKKSPYKLFKMKTIPLNFFKPIGNPLVVLSNKKKSKLEPRGEFGKLLGLNANLKSYRIRLSDGKIINSKSVKFLDFESSNLPVQKTFDLFEEPRLEQHVIPAERVEEARSEEEPQIKEEDKSEQDFFHSLDDNSDNDEDNVAEALIPDPN